MGYFIQGKRVFHVFTDDTDGTCIRECVDWERPEDGYKGAAHVLRRDGTKGTDSGRLHLGEIAGPGTQIEGLADTTLASIRRDLIDAHRFHWAVLFVGEQQ